MDFGIGFLSNNLMLPILDFFYGIVPSYGLAIVALTLVIRFALYPLNAGSIRNMRRMKVTQPLMKERVDKIQKLYKDDPVKQREEMSRVYKELGNPLAGCFPLLLQMPILFALFATLRGSPFSDVNYTIDLQIFPQEQIEQIQPQIYKSKAQNVYVADGVHSSVQALIDTGNSLAVGQKTEVKFETAQGESLRSKLDSYENPKVKPHWMVTKGEDKVQIDDEGNLVAVKPGEVTIQASLKGIAADKGFLFIDALGRVGAFDDDGNIHWDIVGMILGFGISLYINQVLSGQNQAGSGNPQQDTVNKITPVLFTGMFFFFPLPAGVLLYMLIANIFQTGQAFILSREPLPENLQKIVEESSAKTSTKDKKDKKQGESGRASLPFEPGHSKKKA
ncbi:MULTISPECIES: membrane protein insertase YidC [Arthrospira]|jgi:YidC/Oxa1 family membrane protein insertase|uniref:Inner membrane protein n=1 Tax=Limnospira platensis NIES-46 TaxID=1236695 RepID=A0A5M3T856_LIMPL|nr:MULTISPECIES: membrane protein insertase YidC [Arthrospira]AMW31294.1 preprotein translocase YidC [Arthrospira platensis YZ]KDR56077.1 protein translocase component YidC [Arthrospira platensis str. Paraca]MBD2667911.1 membrane protein insertase YidC [Arthrospira platensis FACHB-439]MBD2708951.1 membrane protein insertase YidC [Arthrospira platensis FACHB-835]MDF2208757.1 membrane protein insertase YidC [Arthrospira platensis NCB002]MDT9181321.1 membrane protein insertase YidC [Limnospira s